MRRVNRVRPLAFFVAAAAWACSPNADKAGDSGGAGAASGGGAMSGGVDLVGAGATFPYPLYSKWIDEYAKKTGVKINYQSIGSGGGVKQFSEETVDFGASDAPMSDTELAGAKGGPVFHIPTVIGLVAIAYNLPGVTQPLRLTGPIVADIYHGKITKWSDTRIASVNPGITLPSSDIVVVHRSDGSGTTYVFSDYLSSVSPAWKTSPGTGKDLQWPVGLGAKGNEAVAGQVKQTPGSIGYVELAYVKQNKLSTASIQNAAGQFIAPSAAGATAAAAGAIAKFPPNTDYRVSIVNAAGAEAYPIASFTWLLVYQQMADAAKAKKLVDFVRWALTDGEQDAAALDYAPLPPSLVSRLTARADSIGRGSAR